VPRNLDSFPQWLEKRETEFLFIDKLLLDLDSNIVEHEEIKEQTL